MKYLALLLFSVTAFAQQQNYNAIPDCSLGYCAGTGIPTFACFSGQKFARVDTPGNNYTCTGFPPHWVADAGSGTAINTPTVPTHNFLNAFTSGSGNFGFTQPASTDLSDVASLATKTYADGRIGPIVNVLSQGAKCDGSTDDSTALQNSINLAESSSSGVGTVLIPPTAANKGCVFGTTLNVTDRVTITGVEARKFWDITGSGSALRYTGTGDAIYIHGSGFITHVIIQNLFIDTTAAATSILHFFQVDGPIEVERNTLIGEDHAATGILCDTCGIQVNIHNNNLQSFTGTAVVLKSAGNINFEANQIFDTQIGIYAADTQVTIADNYFELMVTALQLDHFYSGLSGTYDIHGNLFNNHDAPPAGSPVHTSAQRCIKATNTFTNTGPLMNVSVRGNVCALDPAGAQGNAPYGLDIETSGLTTQWTVEANTFVGLVTSAMFATEASASIAYLNNQTTTTLGGNVLLPQVSGSGTYIDLSSGGGGSGVAYPSATQNFVPGANIVGGVTSLVNTAFSDNTTNTFDSEPFYLVGEYQQPTGTANGSNNFVSNVTNWLISYWNGSAAVQASWNVYAWVAQGASPPASVLTYYAPANLTTTAVLYAIDPGLLATSGINYNSPKFKTRGNCWNGSAATLDDWNWQGVTGAGANPTETLQFTHVGCSGAATVEMPGLIVDGAPLIGSGTASNSDISGELAFSSATTATYTWANTYTSHPECMFKPQFSTTVAQWVTYTGTTSFTINFASAVTGSASYICVSRN